MYIDVDGSGPDLVLIHGWAMHGGIFAALRAALRTRFRLHVVDLPGHGRSRDVDAALLEPADCAAAIASLTPPAVWVGWSLGGLVAMQAALDQAASVRALVTIASSPRFVADDDWPHGVAAPVFARFADDLANDFRSTVERFLALETLGSPNAQAELRELKQLAFAQGEPDRAALARGLDILRHVDLRGRLPAIEQPSLWIGGRRDRIVAPAALRWAAEHAADGEMLEINSGHAPFLNDADAVADAIATLAGRLS